MNKNIKKLAKALNISENEVIAFWKSRLKYEEQKNALSDKILCDWGYEDLGKNCRLDRWNNLLLEKIVSNLKLYQFKERINIKKKEIKEEREKNIKILIKKNIKILIKKNIMYLYLLIKPILLYLKRKDKIALHYIFMSGKK